ncbi:DUF4292 domain-containing protein [Hymenobacter radiodurans]|uniref:DUF4292 domain-containing protein n=1 Tax=Hymenobacter radiodurans TaxID=2496028 RepID=UPI001058E0D0|nr:DUF4292 domain-containing protein [Hymenobacter radiodurans]
MSNRFLLLFLVATITLGSCARKAVPTKTVIPPTSNAVRANNVEFRYLSAKGKAQIEQNGNKLPNANLTLRIRRDSVIWISVSVAGFEGVRASITQDSVRVLNKLQREYYVGDFAYLSRQLNVPVSFAQVQALLLGNYLPATNGTEPTITTEGAMQRIQYNQASLFIEQLIGMSLGKLQKLSVRDEASKNNLLVDYSDFRALTPTNQSFAHSTVLQVQQANGQNKSSAAINYRNVDVDTERLDFPFSVPSGYVRKK